MVSIHLSVKCSDMFAATLLKNGQTKGTYDGYVPAWFPNPTVNHYGDYIDLEIDVDTGKIVNWEPPTKEDLAIFHQRI